MTASYVISWYSIIISYDQLNNGNNNITNKEDMISRDLRARVNVGKPQMRENRNNYLSIEIWVKYP